MIQKITIFILLDLLVVINLFVQFRIICKTLNIKFMYHTFIVLVTLILIASCEKINVLKIPSDGDQLKGHDGNSFNSTNGYNSGSNDVAVNNYNYCELMNVFEPHILRAEYQNNLPDSTGAMDRNIGKYFQVRYQMGLVYLINYAIVNKDQEALTKFLSAVNYSFQYQASKGDFPIVVPNRSGLSNVPAPSDSTGLLSFFLSSMGTAYLSLDQSDWFKNTPELISCRNRINSFKEKISLSAHYFLSRSDVLFNSDKGYANRYFFAALSFFTTGEYLADDELKLKGLFFLTEALKLQADDGYFIEKGGYDSSYNGVSLRLAFILYAFLPDDHPMKKPLWQGIIKALQWQGRRILTTGEISAEGNTRVYPGGEKFLGNEKGIDWSSSVKAFYMMYYYTENSRYKQQALLIEGYYRHLKR
jgi:hypothetical protein